MIAGLWRILMARGAPEMRRCAILVRMPIDGKTLTKLLFLARLRVDEAERRSVLNNLTHTLELIDRMHEAPTEGVAPLEHPLAQPLAMRGDDVTEQIDQDDLNTAAPAMHEGSFLVPRVIDGE